MLLVIAMNRDPSLSVQREEEVFSLFPRFRMRRVFLFSRQPPIIIFLAPLDSCRILRVVKNDSNLS